MSVQHPAYDEPIVPRVTPFNVVSPNPRAVRRFPTPDLPEGPDDILGLSIGDLDLFRMRLPSIIRLHRSASSRQCLMLLRFPDSGVISSQGERKVVPAQHTAAIVNDTEHVITTGTRRTPVTGVVLPTSLLSEFAVNPPTHSLTVHAPSTLMSPLWSFLDTLLDQPLPWPSLSSYFAEKLLQELLGSVLLEAASVPSLPFADRSLVERSRHHIAAYARDPRLSPRMVAKSLGVPLRRLQRRFAEVESSLAAEIRNARATATIAVLRSSEGALLDMATIAKICGYQSDVALRRSFAALGLDPPSQYRRTPKGDQ